MILDSDNEILSVNQTKALEIGTLKETARLLKEYAEINYTSKVIEYIYDVEKQKLKRNLDYFWVNPTSNIFKVDGKYYNAKEQEKVLQWLITRARHYHNRFTLAENEIIKFKIR